MVPVGMRNSEKSNDASFCSEMEGGTVQFRTTAVEVNAGIFSDHFHGNINLFHVTVLIFTADWKIQFYN